MLISEGLALPVNLIFEVRDIMRGNLELPLQLDDFVLGLDAVLRVKVALCPHRFIQILLVFHLSLVLHVLFLQLGNQILLQLDLLHHLHQISIGLISVARVRVPLLLHLRDQPHQLRTRSRLQVELLLQRGDIVLLPGQFVLIFAVGVFNLGQILLHHISLPN